MSRSHDTEVPPIERRDRVLLQPLGQRDQAGIGPAERQIRVGVNKIGDPNRMIPSISASMMTSPLAIDRKNLASASALIRRPIM